MNERGPSIAESLIAAGALLDERYRLDTLVRRSTTATIHVATHRNGSTAWLKLPISPAHASRMTLEGRIANTLGSPLVVRDDGKTPNGVPYLVLDPPEADSVATLRARGKKGSTLSLTRILTVGDSLARVVATIHAMGQVTAGLEDEDVLVFATGDVALLDLHALTPATPARLAADVMHVARVLSALLDDTAESGANRAPLDAVLAGSYPDVTALQSAWRAAAPEPVAPPARIRSASLADIPASPQLFAIETPMSVTVEAVGDADGSMIGYLRSGAVPSLPPPAPGARMVLDDPLSKVHEQPRMVQAPVERASRGRGLLVAMVAVPLIALLTGATFLVSASAPTEHHATATAALEARPAEPAPAALPEITAAPVIAPVAAAPAPAPIAAPAAPPAEELEVSTHLRTENAPAGREVLIDGKPVGTTPLDVSVPCGRHALQMVAGAPKQSVELPCGGERIVRYDAKGHWSLK